MYVDSTLIQVAAAVDSLARRADMVQPPLSITEYVHRLYTENDPPAADEEEPPPSTGSAPSLRRRRRGRPGATDWGLRVSATSCTGVSSKQTTGRLTSYTSS